MSEFHAQLDLPAGTQAPAAARHALAGVLAGWGFRDRSWLDHAALIVSELVTNAVLHGGGCIEVSARLHDETVTLSVADGSTDRPRHRTADDTGGRGLAIIDALTRAWGVEDHEGGKLVWAVLPPAPAVPAQPPRSPLQEDR